MQPTFLRTSAQLAQMLRAEIQRRTWVDRLPGERLLAERFQVSRKTVRAALRELRQEGLVATQHGTGSNIRGRNRPTRARPAPATIGVLLMFPLAEQRQHTALWLNKLADLLQRAGYRLEIFSGRKYFTRSGARALALLTKNSPMACWVVAQSTRFVQEWFARSKVPVVIAGSLHRGIVLPSVDIDHLALCRHAAGVLIRAGHRRVALLYAKTDRAGDLESEDGFRQGCARASMAVTPIIVRHGDSATMLQQAVTRLMVSATPPTGLLVANSQRYLTVTSCLAALGRRVPRDVSVLSRDEDPFLYHLQPVPDRYFVSSEKFARQVSHAIVATIKRTSVGIITVRLMPEYRRGQSVASPA